MASLTKIGLAGPPRIIQDVLKLQSTQHQASQLPSKQNRKYKDYRHAWPQHYGLRIRIPHCTTVHLVKQFSSSSQKDFRFRDRHTRTRAGNKHVHTNNIHIMLNIIKCLGFTGSVVGSHIGWVSV